MSVALPPDLLTAELPSQIGHYIVRAKLGEGATSEVFQARDQFHRRDVALKRVRSGFAADSRDGHFQQRFFAAEAALVGRLEHPNVVQIFDAVPDPAGPYLVMELVEGPTLRRFCRANALLPLEQVVEIGFKCAMALGYVYRQGLIHRDVKPANILAVLDGDRVVDVKITDFGSVFALEADHTQVYRVGSLAYMSPEQLEGDALDCRADIFSLAAVLYHLIAGRPPFDATQQAAIMQQICHSDPPPLQALREGVSDALQAVIQRGLAKQREDRFPDWDSFAQALSDLVTNDDVPRGQAQAVLDSERFTLLRSLEFFEGFGDVELWEVVHRAKWERHGFGDAIYRKGEEGNSFHIIASGQVDIYRDGQRVAHLGAGTSVGEMAYLAPSPDLRFIRVLVRRLHAAHEQLAHPRRIL
jgi:serine/threonine protein kinase